MSTTLLCGRCGSLLAAQTSDTTTCPACLQTDLRGTDLDGWFGIGMGEGKPDGLRATGGFTLLEEIGHGGMGQVYRARQQSPDRDVAVKILLPHLSGSSGNRRRFLTETEAMAGLDHPGLLPLYACGETDGRPWLATRLVTGGTLATRLGEFRKQWKLIAELIAGLGDALHHAHARGIIHRDLKPSNILFDAAGSACIADFGLAKWRDETAAGQTLTHAVMGTPAYMAPELARNGARSATTAADVYGLGAVLYELLTGRPPHIGDSPTAVLQSVLDGKPAHPRAVDEDIPRDLGVICLRALAIENSDRYESAAALVADLQRFIRGELVTARPYSIAERIAGWARKHPLAAGLTGLLIAVLAGSVGLILAKNRELQHANRALSTANVGWQAASKDAEHQVAFAIDVLPSKLEPLGRLDLLDSVFREVGVYYDRAKWRPGVDLLQADVRQADFLTKWALILRPQGQIAASLEKLTAAEEQAARTVTQPLAPPEAWIVLTKSRQYLGALKLIQKDEAEGHRLIGAAIESASNGLSRFPEHPGLLAAYAEAIEERTDALLKTKGGEQASLDALETAWRVAMDKAPAEQQIEFRRRLHKVIYYRGNAARLRGEWAAAEAWYRKLLEENNVLAAGPDSVPEDQLQAAIACNLLARALAGADPVPTDPARVQELELLLKQQNGIMEKLIVSDPTNLRWRAHSGIMLMAGVPLYEKRGDIAQCAALLRLARERTREVPKAITAVLDKGGNDVILNGLTRFLWMLSGKHSVAANEAAPDLIQAAKAKACASAEEAFAAALEAFPVSQNNLPQKAISTSIIIWGKHGPPGFARARLEKALKETADTHGLHEFVQAEMAKLDSPAAPNAPSPPQ